MQLSGANPVFRHTCRSIEHQQAIPVRVRVVGIFWQSAWIPL